MSEAETEKLIKADPSQVADRQDLYDERSRIGDMLVQLKDLDGADRAYRDSLAAALDIEALQPASPLIRTDIVLADRKIGDTATARGERSEALDAYRAELRAAQGSAAADPNNASFQRDVAKAYGDLGVAYRFLARLDEARTALTSGREIVARLVSDDARLPGLQEQLDWFDGHLKLVDVSHQPRQ